MTGFQPFGGESMNPAYEAVKMLPDQIGSCEIVKREIPVVFGEGADCVLTAVKEENPDWVICVGQAGGRKGITPEKVAINLQDGRIPDNAGNQPVDEPIRKEGDTAYFTLLPVKNMVEAMKNAGLEASVSYSAGTYVCNDVFYRLLDEIHLTMPGLKGGFIHVPFCNEQVENKPGVPAMSLDDIARGLKICVSVLETEE